jgi:hypothetical protein
MAWVEIEGNYFNTDDIQAVRHTIENEHGFRTELVMVSGSQFLHMEPQEAEQIILAATTK